MRSEQKVVVWGTGTSRREFMFVDDLADACFFLMENYNESEIINIGVGKDITINKLAVLIKQVVDYSGVVAYDKTKPDGVPQKILDTTKLLALGWMPQHDLKEGIIKTYNSFINL